MAEHASGARPSRPRVPRRPRPIAFVRCGGGSPAQETGPVCNFGCTACGTCVEACRFGAIDIGERGVAFVDRDRCRGCGICARCCPQGVIEMVDPDHRLAVRCANMDASAVARAVCTTSCIGCGICERACPVGAIHVEDDCAHIDYAQCISCGMCATKCPRGAIADAFGLFAHE